MRELLGVSIRLDNTELRTTTTIAAVGANVLVMSTAAPAHATTVTSSYLARSDAALASRLIADAHEERLAQHILTSSDQHATLAGACLLDHASAIRDLLDSRTRTLVTVDVDLDALERVAHIWAHS